MIILFSDIDDTIIQTKRKTDFTIPNIVAGVNKDNLKSSFIYDGVKDENDSFEYTRFYSPQTFGKLKLIIPEAINQVFSKNIIAPYRIG